MMTETKSQKFKVYDQEELFRKRRWLQKADAIARAKRAVEAGYPGLDIVCKSVLPSGEAHLYCLGGNSSKCSQTELCHRLLQEGKTMSVEKQEKVKQNQELEMFKTTAINLCAPVVRLFNLNKFPFLRTSGLIFKIMAMKKSIGLALLREGTMFILYAPRQAIKFISKNLEPPEDAYLGVIELRENSRQNAFEVQSVWAKGLWPRSLLYRDEFCWKRRVNANEGFFSNYSRGQKYLAKIFNQQRCCSCPS